MTNYWKALIHFVSLLIRTPVFHQSPLRLHTTLIRFKYTKTAPKINRASRAKIGVLLWTAIHSKAKAPALPKLKRNNYVIFPILRHPDSPILRHTHWHHTTETLVCSDIFGPPILRHSDTPTLWYSDSLILWCTDSPASASYYIQLSTQSCTVRVA
jgi:hypothetical protein